MAGIMFNDYQPSTQKKEIAQAKTQDARQDLYAIQEDTIAVVQKVAAVEDWKSFSKSNFEQQIKANDMRIAKLNLKFIKPAELFDELYMKKIVNLEKENRFLKARLEAYAKDQSTIGII